MCFSLLCFAAIIIFSSLIIVFLGCWDKTAQRSFWNIIITKMKDVGWTKTEVSVVSPFKLVMFRLCVHEQKEFNVRLCNWEMLVFKSTPAGVPFSANHHLFVTWKDLKPLVWPDLAPPLNIQTQRDSEVRFRWNYNPGPDFKCPKITGSLVLIYFTPRNIWI